MTSKQPFLFLLVTLISLTFSVNFTFSKSQEIFLKLGHTGSINSICITTDGKLMATASADNTIKIWDVKKQSLLRTLAGHEADIFTIAFKPNSTILASAGYDKKILIWDVQQGRVIQTLTNHTQPVTTLLFSPDGRNLFSSSRDSTIKIWSIPSGRMTATIAGHRNLVNAITLSSDGNLIASASFEKIVRIWNTRSQRITKTLTSLNFEVRQVEFSPDNKFLAVVTIDNSVSIYSVGIWRKLDNWKFQEPVNTVTFSPDGKKLGIATKSRIDFFDTENWALESRIAEEVKDTKDLIFTPDMKRLISVNAHAEIDFFDKNYSHQNKLHGYKLDIIKTLFSPTGNLLASANEDGTIALWDLQTGQQLRNISAHERSVNGLSFHPNARLLASGGDDGVIKIWNLQKDTSPKVLRGHAGPVYSVDFSPTGDVLASCGSDKSVRLWDVKSRREITQLYDHLARIWSVEFSPNGQFLASASDDYSVKIWQVQSRKLIRTLIGHEALVKSASFSHDSRYLATASSDKTIKIWNVISGELLATLQGHNSSVKTAVFSPDDKLVASGGFDNIIRIWDWRKDRQVHSLSGHENDINSLNFSPSGSRLASGSPDGTIRIWDMSTQNLLLRIANLPKLEWMIFPEDNLFYTASKNAEQFAALRFNNKLSKVASLKKYKKQLKKSDLRNAFTDTDVGSSIKSNGAKQEPAGYAFIFAWVALILGTVGLIVYFKLKQKFILDESHVFFKKLGYKNYEQTEHWTLFFNPDRDNPDAVVINWKNKDKFFSSAVNNAYINRLSYAPNSLELYIIHNGVAPAPYEIHKLKKSLPCKTINVPQTLMTQAVKENSCFETLEQLHKKHLSNKSPYSNLLPVSDSNQFYGQNEVLERLCVSIGEGKHHTFIGFRKFGATSFLQQLPYAYNQAPTCVISCDKFFNKLELVYHEIINQLYLSMKNYAPASLPNALEILRTNGLSQAILSMHQAWKKDGHTKPFLIAFDCIDRFFDKDGSDLSKLQADNFNRLLSTFHNLAEKYNCITLVNSSNCETENWPDNLKQLLQASNIEYLQLLDMPASDELIQNGGLWLNITWDYDAANQVYSYCGGHPYLSRLFAKDACKNDQLKHLTVERVQETMQEISSQISKSEFGRYFEKSIWGRLNYDEKKVMNLVSQKRNLGLPVKSVPSELQAPLFKLLNFGIITNDVGKLFHFSPLFSTWLERKTRQNAASGVIS